MAERTIGERYDLETMLGSGGMGTVWKATDRLLERPVAIKLLHADLAADDDSMQRFQREARAAARLAHQNVVTVHDTGRTPSREPFVDDDIPFIVMEYVEGETLHDMIQRRGPLPFEEVVHIAHSVLGALAHAHDRGLVHRDIKPANVLLDSTTGVAKVVDFGIAKGLDDHSVLTQTKSLIGTASYMSPEQVKGENATPASDLYAVGCLLYCCLAAQPPFGGDSAIAVALHHLNDPVPPLRSRRRDVSPSFEAVVMKALEKEPARRFSSARAMDQAVGAVGLDSGPATQVLSEEPVGDQIKVLLVDDHTLILHALAAIVDPEPDLEVVGTAHDAEEAKALARATTPDVILLDYHLPDDDGVSVARSILAERPDTKIIMLTATTSDLVIAAAIEAGCAGFIPKETADEETLAAIRAVYAGEAQLSPRLLARVLPTLRRGGGSAAFDLTHRETEILRLLAEGKSNEDLAEHLDVTVATIRNHVQHVIKKLGAHSKLEALAIATREGLIDLRSA